MAVTQLQQQRAITNSSAIWCACLRVSGHEAAQRSNVLSEAIQQRDPRCPFHPSGWTDMGEKKALFILGKNVSANTELHMHTHTHTLKDTLHTYGVKKPFFQQI